MSEYFTDKRIVNVLNQHKKGMHLPLLLNFYGIDNKTFNKWKKTHGHLSPADFANQKDTLEDTIVENRFLKKRIADLKFDNKLLKKALKKY